MREQRIGDILRKSDLKPITSIMLRSIISIGRLLDISIQTTLIGNLWITCIQESKNLGIIPSTRSLKKSNWIGWNLMDQESYLWFLSWCMVNSVSLECHVAFAAHYRILHSYLCYLTSCKICLLNMKIVYKYFITFSSLKWNAKKIDTFNQIP